MRYSIIISLLLSVSFQSKGASVTACGSCHVKGIEQALKKLNPGDTIFLKNESYDVIDVELNFPVTIIGSENTILDGHRTAYILKILGDSIHLSNLRLINAGRSYTKDLAAIYVHRSNYFSLINLKIEDPFFGLLVEKSKNGFISDNEIVGKAAREDESGNGIHLWHCDNIEVNSNNVQGMRDGIYLEFVEGSAITDNTSKDNIRYGLHFMFSNNDKYINNTFQNNGSGVAVMFSKFIVMSENRFLKNWGTTSYGLLLKEIYDGEVVNNLFQENTTAIFIEGSTRINYLRNDFLQNGWAIKMSGGCYLNLFAENNFIGNSFDVSFNGKLNDNMFSQNFWGSYSGYDLDRDGLGDVPHRPVKLFSYVVNETPETVVLLRSLFVDIINFSEKVSPIFTPDKLVDSKPSMKAY